MGDNPIPERGHAAVLPFLYSRFVGVGHTFDRDRGDREPQAELDRSGFHGVRPAFLEECVPENASVPVLITEGSILQFFLDGLAVASATFEDREPIVLQLEFRT